MNVGMDEASTRKELELCEQEMRRLQKVLQRDDLDLEARESTLRLIENVFNKTRELRSLVATFDN